MNGNDPQPPEHPLLGAIRNYLGMAIPGQLVGQMVQGLATTPPSAYSPDSIMRMLTGGSPLLPTYQSGNYVFPPSLQGQRPAASINLTPGNIPGWEEYGRQSGFGYSPPNVPPDAPPNVYINYAVDPNATLAQRLARAAQERAAFDRAQQGNIAYREWHLGDPNMVVPSPSYPADPQLITAQKALDDLTTQATVLGTKGGSPVAEAMPGGEIGYHPGPGPQYQRYLDYMVHSQVPAQQKLNQANRQAILQALQGMLGNYSI